MSKIGDYVDAYGDGIHGTPNYSDNGEYYFINGHNIQNGKITITNDTKKIDEREYQKIKRPLSDNTILLSINGTLGNIAFYTGEPVALGKSVCYLNIKNRYNKAFIKYILSTKEFQKYIQLVAHGSTIKNLAPSQIVDYEFPEVSENNQKKIASCLGVIDNKIANNTAISTELESLARTIYNYWFLQFDFPDENGRPYKSSGGKMVWNEALKREIPEGWTVGTFSDTILMSKNGDWGEEKIKGHFTHKVRCLRGADFPAVSGNDKLVAPYRYILEKNTNKILAPGDIIIEISGGSPTQSTGRSCLVTAKTLERFGEDVITSNFCQAVTLKHIIYSEWFYLTWKALYDNGIFFNYEGKTTGIKNLLFDTVINQILIVIPPRCIMNIFHSLLYDLFEKEQANNIENDQLSSLRDFLLPLLMNGQVTIKD
ncbi:restriction endonuclease subunit S [uncultured Dialister sp.]|uniref:restriction endonuclease subunit S n=1 Tax=uncultured Dialister sp. TaxID=278064 RepID=UPI00265E0C93|nr:restriction endonuclease subunit S [uncultured Dialister sp.]